MTAAAKKPSETHLHLAGELLTPLPEGALWWAAERVLVVSDLHFEKGSAFAARGQLLPPYDTAATLSLVERLCAGLQPKTVISLGDSFHDRAAELRLPEEYARRIQAPYGLAIASAGLWIIATDLAAGSGGTPLAG